ncbi:MAG: hypothetical protein KBG32_05095, partial [Sulfuritalea sp.]|nr:hypothetical protein [Sulfuritalea sp.]
RENAGGDDEEGEVARPQQGAGSHIVCSFEGYLRYYKQTWMYVKGVDLSFFDRLPLLKIRCSSRPGEMKWPEKPRKRRKKPART